jgi:isopentenyl diphosphate isomerase/L-lactate dehydrogenase-like FMN-dependent dehydrogenase
MLKTELGIAMTNVGVKSIAEIGPDRIRATVPPAVDPWPVGR